MFPHRPNPLSRPEPPTPLPQFPRDLTALSLLISEKIREYATALLKKVDKVFTARAGDVAVFSAGGNIEDSGVQLSEVTETLADTVSKVPSAASPSNQLADKAWVDDRVNSTSAYYITKNAAGDAFATPAELAAATEFYSGGELRTPTRNDYCLVLQDTDGTAWRYIYGASGWEKQYRIEGDYILSAVRAGTPVYNWSLEPSSVTVAGSGAVLSIDRVRKFTENDVNYWGLYHSGISAPLGRAGYDTGDGDLTFTTNPDLQPGTVAASRDRLDKDIVGYLLGSQTDKPFPALVPDKNGNRTAMTIGSRDTSADIGRNSLTQGEGLQATSSNACARGLNSKATATGAIAEGLATEATADYAHSEGAGTKARATGAHAEGHETRADHEYEHAEGIYNKSNTDTLFSIGAGTSSNDRKNAVEVHKNGKAYVKGLGGYDGTNPGSGNDLATTVEGKAAKAPNPTAGNLAALDAQGNPTNSGVAKSDVENLFFAQYYPDGSVKSAAEFTAGIKYGSFDTTNRTVSVLPFCATEAVANDNRNLSGRVVIPPFVDADGNPYITDDGTRYKVVGVRDSSIVLASNGSLTAIVAPATLTGAGWNVFDHCSYLVSVSLPAATTIGREAFARCTSLTSISVPAATTIESAAFSGCSSLTSLSLPAATAIGMYAFADCSSLESVDFGDTPRSSVPTLGANAFIDAPTTRKIIVPDAQYDAWTAATIPDPEHEGETIANPWYALVQAGYKFLRHSEWEYARNYEVDTKIAGFVDGATYNSTTKKILLKHGTATVAEIDATDFIKDGMVSSVEITGGNLVITFNTDAGQEPITIPLTDIFDPANYYTKTQADTLLSGKLDNSGDTIHSGSIKFKQGSNPRYTKITDTGITHNPGLVAGDPDPATAFNWLDGLSDHLNTYFLSKSGGTLTGRGFTDWVCNPVRVLHGDPSNPTEVEVAVYKPDGQDVWALSDLESAAAHSTTYMASQPYDPAATSLTFTLHGDFITSTVTATREALPGYILGPDEQTNQNRDKPLASEAEAEALRTGKANRAPNPTEGNLAALDVSGNPTDSGVKASDKLDASSASDPFSSDSSVSYTVGEHVTYNGKLYICTTATTGGTWVAASWALDDMTTPDATLDVTAAKQLRVVAANGDVLWAQGYDLGTTSSATLSNEALNKYDFAVNATDAVSLTLPIPLSGKVGDFVLDVTNPALNPNDPGWQAAFDSTATYAVGDPCSYDRKLWRCIVAVETAGEWTGSTNWVEARPYFTLSGLGTSYSVVVPVNENISDILTFAPGDMAELYFTQTAFTVDNLPAWKIVRQDVEAAV